MPSASPQRAVSEPLKPIERGEDARKNWTAINELQRTVKRQQVELNSLRAYTDSLRSRRGSGTGTGETCPYA